MLSKQSKISVNSRAFVVHKIQTWEAETISMRNHITGEHMELVSLSATSHGWNKGTANRRE